MPEGLIVDDNYQTAEALKQLLGVLELPARIAYDAPTALSMLLGSQTGFLCLDINMPGVDGVELLHFVKCTPGLQGVPVIVITSDDQPQTRQRVLHEGAAALIIKPATLDALERALKKAGVLR